MFQYFVFEFSTTLENILGKTIIITVRPCKTYVRILHSNIVKVFNRLYNPGVPVEREKYLEILR